MHNTTTPIRAMALTTLLCSQGIFAAPLTLMHEPVGVPETPTPNVIVSVDNSSSMGSQGITDLKNALKTTFSRTNLIDNRIRLGWQAMHGCNRMPDASNNGNPPSACQGYNGVRRFGGSHRDNFDKWVNSLDYQQGTPSHWTFKNAGDYLAQTDMGVNSPWAAVPGEQEQPVLACRRSFHIFMTDGEYGRFIGNNNTNDMSGPDGVRIVRAGNADGTSIDLPDGTRYDVTKDWTRLYRDRWGDNGTAANQANAISTLSDLAFYYWSRDLQPGIPNKVPPLYDAKAANENFGSESKPALLPPYWNPRNNPATWQHMTTYAIGFLEAASWSGDPSWRGATFTGLGSLIDGTIEWPSPFCGTNGNSPCNGAPSAYVAKANPRKAELWHMALNSRGEFIPAPNAQTLSTAFQRILQDITEKNAQGSVSIAAASNQVENGTQIFLASFDTRKWSGDVQAYRVNVETGVREKLPDWSASTWLDNASLAHTARKIFSHDGAKGITFEWSKLDTSQKAALQSADTATVATQRLNYLRGDRSLELGQTGGLFRARDSRLGSVVNSNLWVGTAPRRMAQEYRGHEAFRRANASRPTVVYVGANDGMLHGFDALTGAELLAYVPIGIFNGLRPYTIDKYAYRALVDGHPFTGDADLSQKSDPNATPDWRTLLVSGLGAGGRGYFVLDVTDPASFSANQVLMDRTLPGSTAKSGVDTDDIGHIVGTPAMDNQLQWRQQQIVQLNNGRWALVIGNGVNSPNERPVLLIQFLDGSRELLTIVANDQKDQSNGLAMPRLIDVNGDGKMDIAYAGDLLGQLWKFNLTSHSQDNWGVSRWDGAAGTCKNSNACEPFARLALATTPPTPQPITTAPIWTPHPLKGIQIVVGTGQMLQAADATDTKQQTVYGIWDNSSYEVSAGGQVSVKDLNGLAGSSLRSLLVEQPVTEAVTRVDTASGKQVSTTFYNSTAHLVDYTASNEGARRGWFVDLPVSGERVMVDPQQFDGPNVAFVSTQPSPQSVGEGCALEGTPGKHWLNIRNMITGRPYPVFQSPHTDLDLSQVSRAAVNSNEYVRLFNTDNGRPNGSRMVTQSETCAEGSDNNCTFTDFRATPKRTDWREVRQ